MLAASAWGAYECVAAGVPTLRAWAATTTAATLPAGIALLMARLALPRLSWLRPWARALWQRQLRRPAVALSLALVAITSLAAAALAPRLQRLEPAARTTGMAFGVALLVAAGLWARAEGIRRLRGTTAGREGAWMLGLSLSATVAWLFSVWQPVSLTLYFLHAAWIPESAVVAMTTWGLIGIGLPSQARWAIVPMGALGFLLMIHHARTDMPNRLRTRLLRQRELTARWLPLWDGTHQIQAPTAEGSSCRPGVKPSADLGVAPDDAPDILFITIDGVAWRHTSFGDPKQDSTPNLLRHAATAAVFDRAYTPATWTRQAFRALFTGLDPGLTPTPPSTKWGVSFSSKQKTLATYLRDAGYETIVLHSEPKIFPPKHHALLGFSKVDAAGVGFVERYRYESNFKVNQAVAHLLELPETAKPRFLWTHILDTHFPYTVGPGTSNEGISEPERHRLALRFVDRELSRLLDFALSPDRRAHTFVVVTADHGEAFTEHGHHRHGYTVYEEELHVPLLIWGPNVEPKHHEAPVSNVDLARTMLDMAGLQAPQHMCGTSLLPSLISGSERAARPVFAATMPDATTPDTFKLAWIEGWSKLIWSPTQGTLELFDLKQDPGEKNNLADAQPERTRAAAARLESHLRAQGRDLETLTLPKPPAVETPPLAPDAAPPEARLDAQGLGG